MLDMIGRSETQMNRTSKLFVSSPRICSLCYFKSDNIHIIDFLFNKANTEGYEKRPSTTLQGKLPAHAYFFNLNTKKNLINMKCIAAV